MIVNTTGGTPTLTLDVGGQVLTATYSGGSGTTSLSFTATAGAGDDSSVSVSAINLNGASIIGNTTSQALLTGTTGQVVTNLIVDNTNPVFTSGITANFAENGTGIVYDTAATDVTTLTYALGGADAGRFDINTSTGAVSFKTSPNFEVPADVGNNNVYDITVTATDGVGNTSNQSVAITVTNVNEAPTVTSAATASFAENGAGAAYTASGTDPDAGTALSYSLSGSDAALFSIEASTGVVHFVSAPNFEAPADAGGDNEYDIVVTAMDNGTLSATKAVAITVTNVNEAPTTQGTLSPQTAIKGQAFSLNVKDKFADVDAGTNGTLSFSSIGLPSGMSINSSTGLISGTATADQPSAQVVVTATDGSSLSVTQSFSLAVVSAPVITALQSNVATAKAGDAIIFTATLSEAVNVETTNGIPTLTLDVGGQTLTATYIGGTGSTSLSFTATAGAGDDSTVSVSAINLNGASIIGNTTSQALLTGTTGQVVASFIVDNINPVFTSGITANFSENGASTAYAAAATDPSALTYSLSGTDAGLFNINSTSAVVTFKVAPNFEAPVDAGNNNVYDITVTATDAAGNASNHAVAITVTNVNEAPTVTSAATASFSENGSGVVYTASATDPDASTTLSYSLSGADAGIFGIDANTGVLRFLSAPNFEAPTDLGGNNVYDIVVTATDNGALSATQAVAITVTNVNEAPTMTSAATTSFAENGSGGVYTASATDLDAGTTLSYSLSGANAAFFSIDASTGVVRFLATPNFEAPADVGGNNVYDIVVTATDNGGLSSTQAVAITVTNVNEAPTVTSAATASYAENGSGAAYTASAADPDVGTTMSYSLSGADAAFFSIDASTGMLRFLATPNFESPTDADGNNVYDIVVTATDNGALSATQAVAITVTNVNEAPSVTSAAAASFAENGSGVVYTTSGTDPDASTTLSYSLSGVDAGTFNIDASTGVVRFLSAPNFESPTDTGGNNVYDILVTATDNGVLSATQAVAITVTNVNDAPTVTSSATASFAENGSGVVYTASGTDPDVGTTLSYSLSGTDADLFNINSTSGVVTFKAAPNFESPTDAGGNNVYDIVVTATDNGTLSATQAVAITVTNVNEAPTVTSAATVSIAENDSGVVYTASATDPDAGNTLSYSLSGTDADLFNINSTSGVVTFKAAPNFEAPTDTGGNNVYDIVVTATDNGSLSATQAVAITVTNVNEAPTVTSAATASFAENGSGAVYTASGTDPDAGDTLSFSLSGTDADLFNINSSSGVVTFKAAPNFESPTDAGGNNVYDIVVSVTDNGTLSGTQAVAITVTNVNEAPTVTSAATSSFAENGSGSVYTASATDPDAGSTLSYSLSGTDADLFNINSTSGVVTFKAAPNFEAPTDVGGNNVYDIVVTVTDSGTLSATKAVAITVTNVNEAPTVTSAATATFAENGSGGVYTASATDPDVGTTMSYSLSGADAAFFSIDASTGVLRFLATPNFESPTDAGGNNIYDIVVTATDNGTLSATKAVAITVTNVNEAPSVTSAATASFAENGSGAVYTASATDPDAGSTLSYTLSGTDADLFNINSTSGVVTFKAAPNFEAPTDVGGNNVYDIVVTATDNGALSATKAVAITVTNVNEAPTVNSAATASFAENGSGSVYTASATDPDAGSTLNYSLSGTDADLFNINSTSGVVTFKAAPNFEAPTDAGGNNVYDIVVTATDNGALSATKAIAITVTNVNEAPTVNSAATASYAENGSVDVYTASATDPDVGTTLSYSLSGTDADLFNINSTSGVVTFKAAPNFEAPTDVGGNNVYDIVVTATDNGALSATKAVAITVTNVNEAPTVNSAATASYAENGSVDVYTASATDPDVGTTLSYSLSGTDADLFNINSTSGVVTLKAAPNFEAPTDVGGNNVYDIVVTATDNGALSATQAVAITVTNVNEAPTVNSAATASYAENGSVDVYTASATDPDVGTTLSYSLSGTDADLFNINSTSGVVTFKAAPNFEAPADAGGNNVYDIVVTATDNGSLSAAKAVAITVTNVNEAPTIQGTVPTQTAVKGQAFSLNVSGNFSDVDAGTNGTLSFSATGLPSGLSINSSTGVISGTPTADQSSAQVVVTATDGGALAVTQSFNLGVVSAPQLRSSALDNVTNFDVNSNIVIQYDQSVTAVAGKYIHLVNDGGVGFRGESVVHTQSILLTDTTQVTISQGKITINPIFDLDLANTYHITLDEGAFMSTLSGLATAAFDGTTSLNFATVTPGTTSIANAVASQKMDADGAMVDSYRWLDIEGIGIPSGLPTALDLVGGNYAVVAKDQDPTGADNLTGYDGIALGNLNVALNNFALGDLIYIDDQGNNLNAVNDLTLTAVLDTGVAPTLIQFAGTDLAGFIEVSLLNSTASFDSFNTLKQLVGGMPVISA
ncbi:putative Ig domain-containing protein [Limnohabitans sp. 2KL-3]|uniref:putative Ig domain-containing protein n=1 Tax=Limnohabitans sp. 2KL-3 TaxID=1100700 RepID=UPI001E554F77|nr:putative Ig domain-containing protein [Limnohabitans sp. 2KL-3]